MEVTEVSGKWTSDLLSRRLINDILASRNRALEKGRHASFDDEFDTGTHASAALAYIASVIPSLFSNEKCQPYYTEVVQQSWPNMWDFSYDSDREALIKAICLLIAQVESMDRKENNEHV